MRDILVIKNRKRKRIPTPEFPAIPESPVKNRWRMEMRKFGALRSGPHGVGHRLGQVVTNSPWSLVKVLDGRNRARVIAESLARVIAEIRITSVRWRSYLPLKTQNLVLVDPAFIALRFESRDWRSLVWYSFHMDLRNGL